MREYLAGNAAALWPKMTSQMHAALKSEDDVSKTLRAAFDQVGHESHLENERVMPMLGMNLIIYTRLAEFDKAPMKLIITIALDPSGNIAGMSLTPINNPAESKYRDASITKRAFSRLAVKDWRVKR